MSDKLANNSNGGAGNGGKKNPITNRDKLLTALLLTLAIAVFVLIYYLFLSK
jgi:hypothetical protein